MASGGSSTTGRAPSDREPTAAAAERVAEPARRRREGVYYTPAPLARAIVAHLAAQGLRPTQILDPACGDGRFLRAAASVWPQATLQGIDSDEAALAALAAALPQAQLWHGDGLAPALGPPPGSQDLVLGNPPYVRCRLLSDAQRTRIRRDYATARGAFNLAVPFVERALTWLRPGGWLALLLPNKVMVAAYGERLRQRLCAAAAALSVLDLSDEDPFDVAAYPVLLLLQRGRPAPAPRVHLVAARLGAAGLELHAQRWAPLSPSALGEAATRDPLLDALDAAGHPPLGERFRLREGLHTGNARDLLLSPVRRAPWDRPVLRGRDCGRYRLSWSGLWVASERAALEGVAGRYANFPPPEVFAGPKLLLREISRHPAASLDPGDHWTLNKVYPLQELLPLDGEHRLACLALLNSEPFARAFRARYGASHLRGGHLQFKAAYVQAMPLPERAALVAAGLPELARQRLALGAQPALEAALDAAAWQAYGVRPPASPGAAPPRPAASSSGA